MRAQGRGDRKSFHRNRRLWRVRELYEFPIAAGTHYHKPSGLKQCKLIILRCWRVRSLKWVPLGKIKVSAGLCPFVEAGGENPFPCLYSFESSCVPWLLATSLIFKASIIAYSNLSRTLTVTLGPASSTSKDSIIALDPPDNPG